MKNQRWPGDYESVREEFRNSKREEQIGLDGVNHSMGNDYMAYGPTPRFDYDQKCEIEASASMQLDTVGMQPHAREYIERSSTGMRSDRKLLIIDGQTIDHPDGIQFSGRP